MIPAAIFSSDSDFPWASLAADHMESLGYAPHVITGLGQGVLRGPDLAREMANVMIELSGGGPVVKCDVDARLTPAGSGWLRLVTASGSRAFALGHNHSCHAFAAHHDPLVRVRDWLEGGTGDACASCTICFGLRTTAVSGGTIARIPGVVRFAAGDAIPSGALLATLRGRELPETRAADLDALWAATFDTPAPV